MQRFVLSMDVSIERNFKGISIEGSNISIEQKDISIERKDISIEHSRTGAGPGALVLPRSSDELSFSLRALFRDDINLGE